MQIITNLKDNSIAQDFIRDVLNPLANDISNYIDAQDSPLGDLNSKLLSIQWVANDNICTCILTFNISPEPFYNTRSIKLAADEACTSKYALPTILYNCFDNPIDFSQFIVTDCALIFTATLTF